MAIDKGLVLAAIEVKLKGKSASKNFKENIAAKWAEKIDTAEDLDSFIEDREDVLIEACSEADRRATAATAKAKEEAGKTTKEDDKKDDRKFEIPDDTPEWAKALIKQNQDTAAKLEAFESKQKTQTITERFKADPRVKDIPDFIRKGYIPTSEEDFETTVEALTGEWKTFADKNKLASHGNDTPPSGSGGGDPTKVKPVSDEKAKEMAATLTGQN